MLALNELPGDIPPQQCTMNKFVDEINSVYTTIASNLRMFKYSGTPIDTKQHRVRSFPHRDCMTMSVKLEERFLLNTKTNIRDKK